MSDSLEKGREACGADTSSTKLHCDERENRDKAQGCRIQERFSVCFLKMEKTQARFQTARKEQEKRREKQGGKGVSGRRRGLDVRGLAQGLHKSEKLR